MTPNPGDRILARPCAGGYVLVPARRPVPGERVIAYPIAGGGYHLVPLGRPLAGDPVLAEPTASGRIAVPLNPLTALCCNIGWSAVGTTLTVWDTSQGPVYAEEQWFGIFRNHAEVYYNTVSRGTRIEIDISVPGAYDIQHEIYGNETGFCYCWLILASPRTVAPEPLYPTGENQDKPVLSAFGWAFHRTYTTGLVWAEWNAERVQTEFDITLDHYDLDTSLGLIYEVGNLVRYSWLYNLDSVDTIFDAGDERQVIECSISKTHAFFILGTGEASTIYRSVRGWQDSPSSWNFAPFKSVPRHRSGIDAWGNILCWLETIGEGWDVTCVVADATTGAVLYTSPAGETSAGIWGEARTNGRVVVWADTYGVQTYTVATGVRTVIEGAGWHPNIDRNNIVYCRNGGGWQQVVLYNIAAGTKTVLRQASQVKEPAIFGDNVAWAEWDASAGLWQVYHLRGGFAGLAPYVVHDYCDL